MGHACFPRPSVQWEAFPQATLSPQRGVRETLSWAHADQAPKTTASPEPRGPLLSAPRLLQSDRYLAHDQASCGRQGLWGQRAEGGVTPWELQSVGLSAVQSSEGNAEMGSGKGDKR